MSDCLHLDFDAGLNVIRLTDEGDDADPAGRADRFGFELTIKCVGCGAAFEFPGLPTGVSPREMMVSPDRSELRGPIVPPGEEIPPGGVGYRVTVNRGDLVN